MRENAEKNRIITRGLLLIFTLIVLFSLSGCWGLMELDKRVLVSMVAIDRDEDGKIKLSVGLIDPRKVENKESTAIIIYTGTGETLHEASRNFISLTGKLLMWPYIKMIIIGPTIAKADILSLLDYFNRKNEIQPNPYIFISNTPAEEIINLKPVLSNIPSVIVENQIKNQEFLSNAPQVQLYQMNEMMFSPEKLGYAPIITKKKVRNEYIPYVKGMAIIKDAKWIGELNRNETRGFLWVKKEVKGGVLVVTLDETDKKKNNKLSLDILGKNKASIKPTLKKGKLSVIIEIKSNLAISEVFGSLSIDHEIIKEIENNAEKQIKGEIESSFNKVQKKWKTDIYGINKIVQRKFPEYWKLNKETWEEIYYKLPIEVKVIAKIKYIGLFESFS